MKHTFINIIFSWEILEKKIEFLEIGPFRKLAKTFSYKIYQFDFLHKFSVYKSPIFQIEIKSFKTFFSREYFKSQILKIMILFIISLFMKQFHKTSSKCLYL